MLHLSEKEYNLNTLFCFESLKEILLELVKSQIKLENDIKNIYDENKKRDSTILEFEKIFKNSQGILKTNEENENYKEFNGKKDENKIKDKKENLIELSDNKSVDIEKIGEKITFNNIIDKKNVTGNENIERPNDNEIENKAHEESINQISPFLFIQMTKQIKDHNKKIELLEENLKNESKIIKNEENQIKNISLDNHNEFKSINEKINSIIQKNNDFEKKIELLQSHIQGLDIMTIFKDDGTGTIDATKVMVKALQEKVFKKFELVEQRYKKDGEDNFKIKNTVENLGIKMETIYRDIESIKELIQNQKEEFDKYKNNELQTKESINSDIINDINSKITKLKEDFEININNKINSIEDKLNNIKLPEIPNANKEKEEKEKNLKMERKINDLNVKFNTLENKIKQYIKDNGIENIKNEIKDIKLEIDKKITKEDLDDLHNLNIKYLNEISNMNDKFELNDDQIKKLNENIRRAMNKLENLQGNLILLQNNAAPSGNKKIIDFSKYVEHHKLKEILNPIVKEIESLIKENDSIRRDMDEIEDSNRIFNKKAISKFEEENNNRFSEFKNFIHKKYLEKYEFNKTIKSLEVQIRLLNGDSKKHDADTWLLAKKNMKCFNCASCESNIKNDNYTTADYLAWKKYPIGERNHRMGQGFSHMLEMLSSDVAKNIEKNEFSSDIYKTTEDNYITTAPNALERASSTKLKINKKELINQEYIKNIKDNKRIDKMKLPKMIQNKMSLKKYEKNINIGNQLFDNDNGYQEGNENIENKITGSPQILKISKKNNNNYVNSNSGDNFRTIQVERTRVEKDNDF